MPIRLQIKIQVLICFINCWCDALGSCVNGHIVTFGALLFVEEGWLSLLEKVRDARSLPIKVNRILCLKIETSLLQKIHIDYRIFAIIRATCYSRINTTFLHVILLVIGEISARSLLQRNRFDSWQVDFALEDGWALSIWIGYILDTSSRFINMLEVVCFVGSTLIGCAFILLNTTVHLKYKNFLKCFKN